MSVTRVQLAQPGNSFLHCSKSRGSGSILMPYSVWQGLPQRPHLAIHSAAGIILFCMARGQIRIRHNLGSNRRAGQDPLRNVSGANGAVLSGKLRDGRLEGSNPITGCLLGPAGGCGRDTVNAACDTPSVAKSSKTSIDFVPDVPISNPGNLVPLVQTACMSIWIFTSVSRASTARSKAAMQSENGRVAEISGLRSTFPAAISAMALS
jgi:hypothetical protein